MTIEDKVREIALAPITQKDLQNYSPDDYFYNLCVKAYNLGIETAAEYVDQELPIPGEYTVCDKEDILNLKIE